MDTLSRKTLVFCKFCGKEIPENLTAAEFCPFCGKPLAEHSLPSHESFPTLQGPPMAGKVQIGVAERGRRRRKLPMALLATVCLVLLLAIFAYIRRQNAPQQAVPARRTESTEATQQRSQREAQQSIHRGQLPATRAEIWKWLEPYLIHQDSEFDPQTGKTTYFSAPYFLGGLESTQTLEPGLVAYKYYLWESFIKITIVERYGKNVHVSLIWNTLEQIHDPGVTKIPEIRQMLELRLANIGNVYQNIFELQKFGFTNTVVNGTSIITTLAQITRPSEGNFPHDYPVDVLTFTIVDQTTLNKRTMALTEETVKQCFF
jgi:hypothetical protein